MSIVAKKFSEIIRKARQIKDVSLRAAATDLGIAPSYLSDIENDRRIPAQELTKKMAEYFEVDYEELSQTTGNYRQKIEEVLKDQPEPYYTYQMFRVIKNSNKKIDAPLVERFRTMLEDEEPKTDGADH